MMMTTAKVKESLHSLIDRIEDRELLAAYLKIIEMGQPASKDPIVGYTAKGKGISESGLVDEVKAASRRVKSGEYTAQEDLEKESANW